MNWKNNIVIQAYLRIKNDLPQQVYASAKKLLPSVVVASVLELLGLFLLFPVITVLLKPNSLESNPIVHWLYEASQIDSPQVFIVCCFLALFVFFTLKNLLIYRVYKTQSRTQFKLASEIVNNRFSSYLRQGSDNDKNTAVLLRNVTQIPYEFVSFVFIPLLNIINELLVLGIVSLIIFFYNPLLFLAIVLFAFPVLFLYNSYYKRKLTEMSKIRDVKGAEQYKYALQSLNSSIEIRLFQKFNFFIPQFKKVTDEFEYSMAESNLLNIFSPKIIETFAVGAILVLILIGAVLDKNMEELGEFLILFSIAAFRMIPSLNKLTLSTNYIKGSFHVFNHLSDLHMEESTSENDSQSTGLKFTNTLSLKDIQYAYPGTDRIILDQVSFELHKNEKIGIIGHSGAGKSTLLSILLQLKTQQSGAILVDSTGVDQQNITDWQRLIGYVPQHVKLVHGSIAENIAFGTPTSEIDYDKVKTVIRKVNLDAFVNSQPDGINSSLGENNEAISGGQLQRIGIARALYFDRSLLVLDESTSALDQQTEKEILDELIRMELTIIFVTHRVNALVNFDRIYELKAGKLSTKSTKPNQ